MALLATLAGAGCPDKSPGFVLVKNVCATDTDCLALDAGPGDPPVACNETTLQCERVNIEAPFQLVLQVRNNRADLGLVDQYTYRAFSLEGPLTDHTLEVPPVVIAEGTVSWANGGNPRLLESEVTFVAVPRDEGSLARSTVVQTRGDRDEDVLEGPNLQARLAPDTEYRIRVQPLLKESAQLPPQTFSPRELEVGDDNVAQIAIPPYEQMHKRSARLLDEEDRAFVGHLVRLEDKQTGDVLSSTATTDEDGEFELYALPDVMANQSFNVVVSLQPFPRWRVNVAIDGSKLVDGEPLVLPIIPRPVEVTGALEPRSGSGTGPTSPQADIVFVSNFPVRDVTGDPQGANWCSWQPATSDKSHPPLCNATITTAADAQGRYSVPLLPGEYNAFVLPNVQSGSPSVYRTSQTLRTVLSQPGGVHGGQTLYLDRAARYEGSVLSFLGKPMPNVTVTARALVPERILPNNEVYQYARSSVAVTDDRGRFLLDVDLGYFDLSVEPPAETGFPWIQQLNREIKETTQSTQDDDSPLPLTPLVAETPVIVAGKVVYDSDVPLEGAVVEAFALITAGPRGRRAVRIGQTVSDETGRYRLALPPAVREEPPQDAGADAGYSGE